MLALCFHAGLRNRPDQAVTVEFVPRRQPYLARPRRRQHHKLKWQLDGGLRRPRFAQRLDGLLHILVGQWPHVPHDVVLGTQDRHDPIARIVVSILNGDGPLQHRADALAHGARRYRLDVPDWREDFQHIGARDLGNPPAADARKLVTFEAGDPVLCLPPAAPTGPLLLQNALGSLCECGHTLDAVILSQRVAAGVGQLGDGQRLLAGLSQRDEREVAESELAAATADDGPLDPDYGACGLDKQVQAVAVGVSTGWDVADEGG